jgi:hypothetical protein
MSLPHRPAVAVAVAVAAACALALLSLAAPAQAARWRPPVVMFEDGCSHDCMALGPGAPKGMTMQSPAMKVLMNPYAAPGAASRRQRRRAWRFLKAVRHRSRAFRSVRAARRMGYRRGFHMGAIERRWPTPFVHYDDLRLLHDGHELDPARPESLVYATLPGRRLKLAGYMFRVPSLKRPPDPLGPLLRWHVHAECDPARAASPYQFTTTTQHCPAGLAHYGPTSMVHVWLTPHMRTAYAQEAPAAALHVPLR